MSKKIAVTLMVKNESSIIERCLSSVLNIADLVIITDTGSNDDTVIRAGLFLQTHCINYKIYTEPFKDFAYNRNKLLDLASIEPIDYVLQIDADEIFELSAPNIREWKNSLIGDYYDVKMKAEALTYHLPRLTFNRAFLRYEGVTHEYLKVGGFCGGILPYARIVQINDSRRRVTNNKFSEDAKLLEKAIKSEKDNALRTRYIFYLAQTYHAMGNLALAKENYLKRSSLGGWKDEVFYCFYQVGKILELEKNPLCVEYYIKAYETLPIRVEPLVSLRDYRAKQGHAQLAKILTDKIATIPKPLGGLFIEEDKYVNESYPIPASF